MTATTGLSALRRTATLAALWTATMFLFAYADIQQFVLQPGSLQEIQAGRIGGIDISQGFLLAAALLMIVPACMIPASFLVPARVARPLTMVMAIAFILITIGTAVMPSDSGIWWYYKAYNVVEVALLVTIVIVARRTDDREQA